MEPPVGEDAHVLLGDVLPGDAGQGLAGDGGEGVADHVQGHLQGALQQPGLLLELGHAILQELAVQLKAHGGDVAGLLLPQEVAGAPDFQVLHGQAEARPQVGEAPDGAHALPGVGGQFPHGGQQHIGVGLLVVSPHPPPQLVELRKPELVGPVHDDGVGVGDVDAAFDDGGGD